MGEAFRLPGSEPEPRRLLHADELRRLPSQETATDARQSRPGDAAASSALAAMVVAPRRPIRLRFCRMFRGTAFSHGPVWGPFAGRRDPGVGEGHLNPVWGSVCLTALLIRLSQDGDELSEHGGESSGGTVGQRPPHIPVEDVFHDVLNSRAFVEVGDRCHGRENGTGTATSGTAHPPLPRTFWTTLASMLRMSAW